MGMFKWWKEWIDHKSCIHWAELTSQKATQSFELEIPITSGKGSNSISQSTFGKTLNGTITINHGMQRIDTIPNDLFDTWTVILFVNGKEIAKRENVKNGDSITEEGIKTKFLSKTKFEVILEYSLPWDLVAHINLAITY